MDITGGVSAASLDQYSKQTGDSVTIATMNKALKIQASTAVQLINSVPAPAPTPSNLGQHINIKV